MTPSELFSFLCHIIPACLPRVYEKITQTDLPFCFTRAAGCGGMDFNPPFQWILEKAINPTLLIYFTDLLANPPRKDLTPPYPVLWLSLYDNQPMPFGKVVLMHE